MSEESTAEPRRNRSGELHIRNLDLVLRLKKQAEKQARTNNAQACLYLEQGLKADERKK